MQATPAGDQFEWTDTAAEGDRTYEYELGWFDGGTELRFGPVQVTTPDWAPRVTALTGIRPNPASGSVELRFTLASRSTARLDVFDVAGRRVTGIVDGPFDAGDHGVTWDGRTGDHRLSSGIYFVRLRVGDRAWTRKLTWVDGS